MTHKRDSAAFRRNVFRCPCSYSFPTILFPYKSSYPLRTQLIDVNFFTNLIKAITKLLSLGSTPSILRQQCFQFPLFFSGVFFWSCRARICFSLCFLLLLFYKPIWEDFCGSRKSVLPGSICLLHDHSCIPCCNFFLPI